MMNTRQSLLLVGLCLVWLLGFGEQGKDASVLAANCGYGQQQVEGECVLDAFLGVDVSAWDKNQDSYLVGLSWLAKEESGIGLLGLDAVNWGDLEAAPLDQLGPRYDFRKLDALVQAATENGLVIDLGLNCRSPWATERDLGEIGRKREPCCDFSPPRPDAECLAEFGLSCEKAWENFVYVLLERYDADGDSGCRSDLPGDDCYRPGDGQRPGFVLDHPAIRQIVVGNEPEAPGHFFDALEFTTVEEAAKLYDRVLAPAFRGAKSASPEVIVVRGKSNPGHVFDDLWQYEDGAIIDQKVRARLPGFLEFIEESLVVSRDHFDVFGINYNDHYSEIIGYSRWLKWRMEKLGMSKPLLSADARAVLYSRNHQLPVERHYLPSYYATGFVSCGGTPKKCVVDSAEKQVLWQADKVRQGIRKIAIGLSLGHVNLSLQPLVASPYARPFRIDSGLVDQELASAGKLAESREPLLYALKQLAPLLSKAHMPVETLDVGGDVFAVRLSRGSGHSWIIWNENSALKDQATGLVQRHQEVVVDLTAHTDAAAFELERFVTGLTASRTPIIPPVEVVSANRVPLDETPVLLHEL
ncbi:MAG: hypothetical protein P8166_00570 [Candidatus Thiodiazotropha sp.]